MYQTTAIFFDGKSSASRPVELQVNERIGEFRFVPEDDSPVIWQLDDIRYEKYGSYLEVKNVNDSVAFLQITDKEFIAQFLSHLRQKNKISGYEKLLSLGLKKHLVIAGILFAFIVVGYIYLSPVVAEKAVVLIPESFDDYLGSSFMMDYMTASSVDSAKTEILNEFAAQLELNNTRPLTFTVVDSYTVNAFALPDGNIVLYTGLLNKMEKYEELAGLIGHEVVHVNQRHSLKMLCKNLAGYIFISALFSDVNGIMAVIADNAHNLNSLSYSREYEREADREGTALMIQNNIDPCGMIELFGRLQEDDKFTVPEFLSSHPITNDRIQYIEEYILGEEYEVEHSDDLSALFGKLKKE
jgi:Putative Zn-dependent protease, contains TPR repeats